MGTAAGGGTEARERGQGVSGDRPIGAAGIRQQSIQASPPSPPVLCERVQKESHTTDAGPGPSGPLLVLKQIIVTAL